MFCHKCGAKAIDGAQFCQKCGAKLINNGTAESATEDIRYDTVPNQGAIPVAVSASENGTYVYAQDEKSAKEKSKRRFFIIGTVILVIIIIIIAVFSRNREMDYIATVKDYTPFANSQGLPYTCEEVFGRYVEHAVWITSGDGDTRNVTVSGTVKGTDIDISVTVKASPDPDDSKRALMSPVSVKIGDNSTSIQNEVGDILYLFFGAYDNGIEDLSELREDMYDLYVLLDKIAEVSGRDVQTLPVQDGDVSAASVQDTITVAADDNIRNAYIQKIQELAAENSDLKFGLIDLISNNVYALVADMPGYYVNVYVYDNGSVIPIMEEWGYGAGGNQGYQYLPGKNIILNSTLDGAGREVYETYMCVDSNNKVVNVYDYDLCFSYPSSYYYGSTEIDEFEYNAYQVHGEYGAIEGNLSADEIISSLNSGTDIRSTVSGEILFNDRTVESFLNVPVNSIMKQWGEPLEYNMGGGWNYCMYDGITLDFDFAEIISNVSLSPEMCTVDGNTLNKDRDGLLGIFGVATYDEWGEDFYHIYYADYADNYTIYIYLQSPDDKPSYIGISPKHFANGIPASIS